MKEVSILSWLVTVALVGIVGCTTGPGQPTSPVGPSAAGLAGSTERSPVPLKSELTGTAWFDFTNPLGCTLTPFTVVSQAAGTATHFGSVRMSSQHCVTGANAFGEPLFAGTAVYRAANGDELHSAYDGTLHGAGPSTTMDGSFVITGGTGHFADASGSGEWSGAVTMNSPAGPWAAVWHKQGTIVY